MLGTLTRNNFYDVPVVLTRGSRYIYFMLNVAAPTARRVVPQGIYQRRAPERNRHQHHQLHEQHQNQWAKRSPVRPTVVPMAPGSGLSREEVNEVGSLSSPTRYHNKEDVSPKKQAKQV